MIIKILLDISGTSLIPERISAGLEGEFIVVHSNSPDDLISGRGTEKYEFGNIFIMHPLRFEVYEDSSSYEEWFVSFIERNYLWIERCGGNEISLFVEIFYSGEQCNFEIFNKNLLSRLTKFNVSIPISIYLISESEMENWINEIIMNKNKQFSKF